MQIIKHVVIDLYREMPSIMVTAKQNDSGSRYIAARLTEDGSLFDLSLIHIYVHVSHGFVSWMNGEIDCAPEYMYENSYAYEEEFVI